MTQKIFDWFSQPQNLMLVVVTLIQVYKLVKNRLPESVTSNVEKAADFLSWAVPSAYQVIESLEAQGLINKASKFSKFMDLLMDAAKKQGVTLSGPDLAKAKLLVEGIAQASKAIPQKTLPTLGLPTVADSGAPSNSSPSAK